MKRQNFFFIVALLFMCNTIFAQTMGGYPIGLKPWNPNKPPIEGYVPEDTIFEQVPFAVDKLLNISCYKELSHITLQCNTDERVEVIIYEMLSGVKYTSIINMVAGEIYTIDTPWGAGFYTIRLILSDGAILEGDF